MRYFGSAMTDIGISKQTNQDSVCLKIAKTKKHGQIVMALMCDGMGGLSKGELASATVVRTLVQWFEQALPQKIGAFSWQALSAEWDGIIKAENYKILEYGQKINAKLGTTLSALLIIDGQYMIAHVGDSRVYRITDSVEQLTKDQTFIAREVERGNMTAEQARQDPRKNVLLQCVGASRTVVPQFLFGKVSAEAVFMLCSDGFRHELSEQEIYEHFSPGIIRDTGAMDQNGRYLIDLVKNRKEKDNISVALIKCTE